MRFKAIPVETKNSAGFPLSNSEQRDVRFQVESALDRYLMLEVQCACRSKTSPCGIQVGSTQDRLSNVTCQDCNFLRVGTGVYKLERERER